MLKTMILKYELDRFLVRLTHDKKQKKTSHFFKLYFLK